MPTQRRQYSESFDTLPFEVLRHILILVGLEDLLAVSSVNRRLRDVFENSLLLVYRAALLEAGMVDLSDSSTSESFTVPVKLKTLKQRQERWRTLQHVSQHDSEFDANVTPPVKVKLNFETTSFYDLSSGVYFLGERQSSHSAADAVRFLDLPMACAAGESIRRGMSESHVNNSGSDRRITVDYDWQRIEGINGEHIVDFASWPREHDLAALISEFKENETTRVSVHLRQLSTGSPHPLAKNPSILLQRRPNLGRLGVILEVSGPNLLVLLKTETIWTDVPDWLALYNWYTGEQITFTTSRNETWHGFAFLTDQTFLLPNTRTATLDIIQLPIYSTPANIANASGDMPIPDRFAKLLSLHLPQLKPGIAMTYLMCRSEPNPFGCPHPNVGNVSLSRRRGELIANGETCPYMKGTPLVSASESAIILLQSCMVDEQSGMEFTEIFFVHRSSIVNVIEERRASVGVVVPGPIGLVDANVVTGDPADPLGLVLQPDDVPADLHDIEESNADGDFAVDDVAEGNAEHETTEDIVEVIRDTANTRPEDDVSANAHVDEIELNPQPADLRFQEMQVEETAVASSAQCGDDSREVLWSEWGPDNTRWVPREMSSPSLVTTTCGQRAVHHLDDQITVWDFNPYAVKRERHRMRERVRSNLMAFGREGRNRAGEGDNEPNKTNNENGQYQAMYQVRLIEQPSKLDIPSQSPFSEVVESKLPYVESKTPHSPAFTYHRGIMLDEDHIIGLRNSDADFEVTVYSV